MTRNSLLLVATLCVSVMLLPSCAGPQRTAAGKFMDKPGVYASPNGIHAARIVEPAKGWLNYSFTTGSFGPRSTGSGPADPFPADFGWFMCFDDQDRLWAYVPYRGVDCFYPSGVMHPGEYGGWDGVPHEFFDRLPPDIKAKRITTPAAPKK